MSRLHPGLRLREFFHVHYLPHRIEDPTSRNMEGYNRALTLWEEITTDPPLEAITLSTLADFKAGLYTVVVRGGRRLGARSIRAYLEHVLWILKQAGPVGPRELATAAGLINWYPTTKLPRVPQPYRRGATVEQIRLLYAAADDARLPDFDGLRPGALWRGLLSTMCCTSLRIGQLGRTPMSALELRADPRPQLVLPAGVCPKSKREEPHPLNRRAVADLVAIRGDRVLLFPIFERHPKTTIYRELKRLCRKASIPYTTFHTVRRRVLTEMSAIDPAAAQFAAGHSSYQTTKQYQLVDLLGRVVDQLDILRAG